MGNKIADFRETLQKIVFDARCKVLDYFEKQNNDGFFKNYKESLNHNYQNWKKRGLVNIFPFVFNSKIIGLDKTHHKKMDYTIPMDDFAGLFEADWCKTNFEDLKVKSYNLPVYKYKKKIEETNDKDHTYSLYKNNELYFSKYRELNDAMDLIQRESFGKYIDEKLTFDFKNPRLFSVTDRKDNSMMWGQYASEGKGLCFEFNLANILAELPVNNTYLSRVYYIPSTRTFRRLFQQLSKVFNKNPNYYMICLLFCKNSTWREEREIRIITQLDNLIKRVEHSRIFALNIDESCEKLLGLPGVERLDLDRLI